MIKRKFIIPVLCGLLAIGSIAVAGSHAGWLLRYAGRDAGLPSAREEFKKLYERSMRQDSSIDLSGTILLYDGENRSKVKESNVFHFIKNTTGSYSQLGYLQSFSDGELLVELDTVNRLLVVAGGRQQTGIMKTQPSVDALFSDTAAWRVTGIISERDHQRVIRFSSNLNPAIRSYSLIYDPATYRPTGAEIEWWKDAVVYDTTHTNRVWITRISYQYHPPSELHVDEMIGRIITLENGHAVPAGTYKDYRMQSGL